MKVDGPSSSSLPLKWSLQRRPNLNFPPFFLTGFVEWKWLIEKFIILLVLDESIDDAGECNVEADEDNCRLKRAGVSMSEVILATAAATLRRD